MEIKTFKDGDTVFIAIKGAGNDINEKIINALISGISMEATSIEKAPDSNTEELTSVLKDGVFKGLTPDEAIQNNGMAALDELMGKISREDDLDTDLFEAMMSACNDYLRCRFADTVPEEFADKLKENQYEKFLNQFWFYTKSFEPTRESVIKTINLFKSL